ncbi:MAG: hypothetical protein K0S07_876 [Chlamydiales bacterium]|jgi:hypothetical protein|nr:hypothetical protein [Chlamydiales bacterium]
MDYINRFLPSFLKPGGENATDRASLSPSSQKVEGDNGPLPKGKSWWSNLLANVLKKPEKAVSIRRNSLSSSQKAPAKSIIDRIIEGGGRLVLPMKKASTEKSAPLKAPAPLSLDVSDGPDGSFNGVLRLAKFQCQPFFTALEVVEKTLIDQGVPAEAVRAISEPVKQNMETQMNGLEQRLLQKKPAGLDPRSPLDGAPGHGKFIKGTKTEIKETQKQLQRELYQLSKEALRQQSPSLKKILPLIQHDIPILLYRLQIQQLKELPVEEAAFNFTVQGKDDDLKATSFFKPIHAYSSALPRNRHSSETAPANFHWTEMRAGKEEQGTNWKSSRSATPVEFGIANKEERKKSTEANLRQILAVHAREKYAKLAGNSPLGSDPDHPITVPVQLLQLMTVDLPRHVLSTASNGMLMKLSEDERVLYAETSAAAEAIKDKLIEVPLEDGSKIFVKYDLLNFNVPSNRYQDSLTNHPLLKPLATSALMERNNQKALQELKAKMKVRCSEIQTDFVAKYNQLADPLEKAALDQLRRDVGEKRLARKELSNQSTSLQSWQSLADELAMNMRLGLSKGQITLSGQEIHLSDEGKELLKNLWQQDLIEDCYLEVEEMFNQKVYENLALAGQSRFALGSRLLYLGHLLEFGQNFNCRSGKDRTGLQDAEVKLFMAECSLAGRIISFHEAEGRENHQKNRVEAHHQTGNHSYNPKANVGFDYWNVKGSKLMVEDAELQKAYPKLSGAVSLLTRPRLKKGALKILPDPNSAPPA